MQRETPEGIAERLSQEIAEMERQTRTMVEGALQGGEWESSLQGYVQARERFHLKQELFERIQQQHK